MRKCVARLIVHLYSALLGGAVVCLLPVSRLIRSVRRWELGQRWGFGGDNASVQGGRVIWAHAASLGECKLLCRFVALATRVHPDDRYVLTAVTRTGVEYLRTHTPHRTIAVGFLPIDTIGRMRSLLRRFAVERVWIMETELWPSMLWTCRCRGVPVGIVNARIERRPFRRYQRFGALMRPLIGSLDLVLAQDEQYAERFRALGVAADRVHVVGNLKASVSIEPVLVEQRRKLRAGLGIEDGEMVVTAGCLHPGEGRVVAEAIEHLNGARLSWRWLIVPRHREAVPALMEELGPSVVRLDGERMKVDGWRVAVVDRYGVLDEMYALADAAVVGGTFVDVGGHSMWDAARYGIPVVYGPWHYAQQASCEQLTQAGVGFETASSCEMTERLRELLGPGADSFVRARDELARRMDRAGAAIFDTLP